MENYHNFDIPNKEENRQRQANLLIKFLKQTENIKSFEGKKFEDIFSNEKNKKNFIKNIDGDDFLNLLDGLNGILRNKDKNEWKTDGQEVTVGSNRMIIATPPIYEDRKDLLKEVLHTAKEMNKNEKNLEDIAFLFLASIKAIHAYADGNGRTARFIYKILTTDTKDDTSLKQVISNDGREKIDIKASYVAIKKIENEILEKINPESIINLYTTENPNFLKFNHDITPENKKYFLNLIENDKKCLFISIINFFQDNPDINLKIFFKKMGENKYISTDYLIKKIDNKQIKEIFTKYRELKKEIIEFLIHSIAEPEKEKFQIKTNNGKKSAKDILKE